MNRMRWILLLSGVLIAGHAAAVQPAALKPPDAATEITGLIDRLGRSGCEFERNGTWYAAARAKSHLARKYEWLRKRKLAGTTELFIERAASRSSLSGRPYHVRCPGGPATESATWFGLELKRLRGERSSP